jgi:hypothetical protein
VSALATLSSLERAERCPISFALPQVHEQDEDAARGHVIHDFLRRCISGASKEAALEHVEAEHKDTCRGINLAAVIGDFAEAHAEVAYAINTATLSDCRELGRNIGRAYGTLAPYELAGTIDVSGRLRVGRPAVGDFKTGWVKVTPVIDNRQIHGAVTAERILTGEDEIEGRIWQVRPSGEVFVDAHVFDAFELDEIASDVQAIHTGVVVARDRFQNEGTIVVSPGEHCRHCPAMLLCPAHVELARAMSGELGAISASLSKLTLEQRWNAWQKVKEAEAIVEAVKASLKELGRQEPFVSPDGTKEIRPITFSRTDFSKPLALSLIRELGGTEEQIKKLWVPHPVEQFRTHTIKKPSKKAKKALPPAATNVADDVDTSPSSAESRAERGY